ANCPLPMDEDISSAVHTYSVLTIGDSLVSQIPAFIIAVASGILVTKATSKSSLGQEIGVQFISNPQPLALGAIILFALGMVPGMPKVPFFALAAGLWLLMRRASQEAETPVQPEAKPEATASIEEARANPAAIIDDFLSVDRAGIEIGAKLIPLAKAEAGNVLLDRVMTLRRDMAKKNGVWVPSIRIRDNIQLDPEAYRLFINGREVAKGTIRVGAYLALTPAEPLFDLAGEPTQEPAFGLPAMWISENDKARAELAGYTVVDAVSVLITHLGEVLRKHAAELLGREDLKQLIEKVRVTSPTLVDELIPTVINMGTLHRVLTLLLEENVPISNLTRILESLGNQPMGIKDPAELAERIRVDLGAIVCARFRDPTGRISAIMLDPRLELELQRAIRDKNLIIDPGRLEKLIVLLANAWRKGLLEGREVALLTDGSVRKPLRNALVRTLSDLSVIAYQEVPADFGLQVIALIRPEDLNG
ncbi:MAG: FHIPEP family type III secretion protein, partial [Planctomycetes bacterium]|nr:FHIPEP family type III secretion protein [Planctomycetota bacterium]